MKAYKPVAVDDAVLVSSNVPDDSTPLWSSKFFNVGEVARAGNNLYEALVDTAWLFQQSALGAGAGGELVRVSNDGNLIFVEGESVLDGEGSGQRIRVYASDGTYFRQFPDAICWCINPDGSRIFIPGTISSVVYSVSTGSVLGSLAVSSAYSAVWSPNGNYIATLGLNLSRLRLIDASDYSIPSSGLPTGVSDATSGRGIAFSPDSSLLAVPNSSNKVYIIDVSTWAATRTLTVSDASAMQDLAWADGFLAVGHAGGAGLTVYRTDTWSVVGSGSAPYAPQNSGGQVAFSADGGQLIVLTGTETLGASFAAAAHSVIWNTTTWSAIESGVIAALALPDYEFLEGETVYFSAAWASGAGWVTTRLLSGYPTLSYISLPTSTYSYPPDYTADAVGAANAVWLSLGAVDRWKMFDGIIGSSTVADESYSAATYNAEPTPAGVDSGIAVELEPGVVCDTLTALGLVGTYFDVVVRDSGGSVVYSHRTDISDGGKSVVLSGISGTSATDTWYVSVHNASGDAECSNLLLGAANEIGAALSGWTVQDKDYSRIVEDDNFGTVYLEQGDWVAKASGDVLFNKTDSPRVFDFLASVRATNCVWIPSDASELAPLLIYGFRREFSMKYDRPNHVTCSLELRGLI